MTEAARYALQISVDQNANIQINFGGHPQLAPVAVGALEIAKLRILASIPGGKPPEIGVFHTENAQNACGKNESQYNSSQKLTKSEALGHYLEERQKIEARLQAIANADDRATFTLS